MIIKSFFIILFTIVVFANDILYTNFPKSYPNKKIQTDFGKKLIRLIDSSQESIHFAIYGLRGQNEILQALIKAQKRGLDIKAVVDSDSHGKNYYNDTCKIYEYFSTKSDHKSYIMHNKFFIFDHKIIWSGSSNISDTGTGGYNANDVMVIESVKIANIYEKEFNLMFGGRFSSKKEEHSYKNVKTKDSIISVYFSPKSNTYKKALSKLIKNAKEFIYIPIFYLTHKGLAKDLIEKAKDGVEIKIILDASAARNRYSIHKRLRKAGIAVKVENFGGKMHCKSIIIDDKYIVSGSMNLTKAGVSKNDENTLIVKNVKLAKKYKRYFLKLWQAIPNRYLYIDPSPEGKESGNSCSDGIDNNFNGSIDEKDWHCR